jgi:hypothetical protein
MPRVDADVASSYQEAWAAWMKQAEHLNRVFLEDEAIEPMQMKGLLNREARAFEKFGDARDRLLGIDTGLDTSSETPGGNPFR